MSFIEHSRTTVGNAWDGAGGWRGDSCCSRLVHASDPPPHVILVSLSGCPYHLRMGNFRAEGSEHLSHIAQYIWPKSTQGEPLSSYQLPWRARHIPSLLLEWIPEFNSSAPAGVPLPGGELNPSLLSCPAFSELGLPGILIFLLSSPQCSASHPDFQLASPSCILGTQPSAPYFLLASAKPNTCFVGWPHTSVPARQPE